MVIGDCNFRVPPPFGIRLQPSPDAASRRPAAAALRPDAGQTDDDGRTPSDR